MLTTHGINSRKTTRKDQACNFVPCKPHTLEENKVKTNQTAMSTSKESTGPGIGKELITYTARYEPFY
jgi:hypothetical protein